MFAGIPIKLVYRRLVQLYLHFCIELSNFYGFFWTTWSRVHGADSLSSLLLGIQYYTGQLFDMKSITEAGHKKVVSISYKYLFLSESIPSKNQTLNIQDL